MTHHKPTIAMKRAWALAREGRTLYGGRVRAYLAEALRLAWAQLRASPILHEVDRILAGVKVRMATRAAPLANLSSAFHRAALRGGAYGRDPMRWAGSGYHAVGR